MLLLFVSGLLGLCASATCSGATYYTEEQAEMYFQLFVRQYDKQYINQYETELRFKIFKDNLMKSNQLNRKNSSAVFGITKFMDLTKEEFRSMYMGLTMPKELMDSCQAKTDVEIPKIGSPDSHDWRQHGAVTGAKDQGQCGSCWAFSSIGNIEGQYAIKHGNLQQFSEQQLVDCNTNSMGCDGGDMAPAFQSLIAEGGVEGEQDYPYSAHQDKCQFKSNRVKAKLVGCYTYNLTSDDSLKDLVYQTGPISIAIQANALQMYDNGIITAQTCNTGTIDHAVLVVGYGSDGNDPYWIIKNSWGPEWGEHGFFRVERKGTNTCSMMNDAMATSVVA